MTNGTRRWIAIAIAAMALTVIGTIAGVIALYHHPRVDPRLAEAFALAQRGDEDRALQLARAHLADHPDDPDALVIAFLADWWKSGVVDELAPRLDRVPLSAAQRAMIHGLELIAQHREADAIAALEAARKASGDAVEILYALGEAQWAAGQHDLARATLDQAFARDRRWQMALRHAGAAK
ncbi:MAG: tetratricopeptide repeat protein [Acidobacteriota bacterium]